jgi:hypothetical protein
MSFTGAMERRTEREKTMNASTHRPVTIAAAIAKADRAAKAAEVAMNAAREAIREELLAELPNAYVRPSESGSLVCALVWHAGHDDVIGLGWDRGQWCASHDVGVGYGPTVQAALADLAKCGDDCAAVVARFLADCE